MIDIELFKIYLIGGMQNFGKDNFAESNNWRVYCQMGLEDFDSKLYRVKVYNPNDYFNFTDQSNQYNSEREVMELDLNKLRNSDMAIINFNDKYSLGSMAELGIAYERHIPVMGLDINKQELHPWQIEMCNRIFTDINEMLSYVTEMYLI